MWDAAPWLAELRQVPPDATWPRLMTLPHPRAVGTYGPEIEDTFARLHGGKAPRWWQRLAFARIGEHDAAGHLVWPEYLGTLSRQGGKSWGLRALAFWRLEQAPRFGDDQLVVHTGRDKGIVLEIARPAMAWSELNGLEVVRNNGREEISTGPHQTGSRWVMRAKDAVYGLSATAALVDEGWDVEARYVDEGLGPTMVEQTSPQLGLWSTAHRRATGLMLDRRALAVAQLYAPVDVLLLDWSTPEGMDRGDPAGWRMASPHWSPARERLISRAYRKVLAGESVDPSEPDPVASFDAQWLNRWPQAVVVPVKVPDAPLVDSVAWSECRDDDGEPDPREPVWLTLEDDLGRGVAAAATGTTVDGRLAVGGHYFADRAAAVAWLAAVADAYVDVTLLVGASLFDDPDVTELDVAVDTVGAAETKAALPLLRELVRRRSVVYDGRQDDLRVEIGSTRVRAGIGSAIMLLAGRDRSALLRCVAWGVHAAHQDREQGTA